MKKKTQCFATALPVAILPLLRGLYYHLLEKESGRNLLRKLPFLTVPEGNKL